MPPTAGWQQCLIEFAGHGRPEQVAANRIAPALTAAQDAGQLDRWWYINKPPGWRLRYWAAAAGTTAVAGQLNELVAAGEVRSWVPTVYEPETVAFGGPAAMTAAHAFFHRDSRQILGRVATPSALGRRETTILLFSAMLRAARLDWFEQGDTWAKIADLRPPPRSPASGRLAHAMGKLMIANPRGLSSLVPSGWIDAFETTGADLATLARAGQLERGLRAVLAQHFIFHANRAGLSGTDQAAMAALAVNVIFHQPAPAMIDRSVPPTPVGSKDMISTADETMASPRSAEELRTKLADHLCRDVIHTAAVEAAFRAVPRHLFLPGVPLDEAYADAAVYTKHDDGGVSISAASQPRIVALMLEQLQLLPGHRALELGTGTGYNAALMAAIAGDSGHVTSIDIDLDLVDGARKHLAAAGVANVDAVLADGALGHPDGAPYDRIIATVGAFEMPPAWLDQLAPDGLLVVPIRLAGVASRSIAFRRDQDGWASTGSEMCTFMPLRGIGDDSRGRIDLTGTGEVTLQTHRDNDHATDQNALAGVLDTARHETWTGTLFAPMESFEWLYLWLACRLDNPIMRMNVEPAATDRALVTPMFPTVAMSTSSADGSLAYLTIRPAASAPDGGKRYEIGVVGHGPTGGELADYVAREINLWDQGFRDHAVRFAIPNKTATADPDDGYFVLNRSRHPIIVTWG